MKRRSLLAALLALVVRPRTAHEARPAERSRGRRRPGDPGFWLGH